ncbi:MAG: septum formation inhibitor Maf [Gammaproteobacteria bacterium]|nr:septum formation inhibitor Maf [Gammaproteobacteria bacterium]
MSQSQLVLASTSPFRKELLSRLQLDFETASPDIDESPLEGEPPLQLVYRLAEQKAKACASQFPDALLIGSDQIALLGDQILGKPGNHEKACQQLKKLSGQYVSFLTGLCLYNAKQQRSQIEVIQFNVYFRILSDEQIENYLRAETPYNCAGSFKSEAMGVALFDRLEGDDPTALIGLPLIRLTRMLENEGVCVI